MIVMGLDLSTKSGVALVESGKNILFTEEVVFKKLTGFDRVAAIAARIMEIKEQYSPDFAVIENYGFANAHTLVPLVEIGTAVRYFMWQESFPYLLAPPTSLKKFVTGSGNAAKDQVMMAVYKNWGYESKTNNIADAVGLGMFGLGCTGEKFPAASLNACLSVVEGQPGVIAGLSK